MKVLFLIAMSLSSMIVSSQMVHQNDDGRTITIPVIFHVISSKKNVEIDSYVTSELIKKEIEDLNANYSASNDMTNLHSDFKSKVGNPNIKFYLADYKVKNGVSGIIRKTKPNKSSKIEPSNYLNIFITEGGNTTSMSPGHNVSINYKDVGKGGQTVTHELGHYFGLWHVWGSSNCRKIKWFSNRSDYIKDTPEQKNCTDISRKKPCPTVLDNSNKNFNNFMDYSSCRCMFTKEQAVKMRINIINDRPEIYKNSKIN
ncbi:M43 family zinc metalloprotease [uncultured Zobellia sp.]|uniref:M43 family zinc metalloprotease n=1 Tax=uncultured Zobellia sp. TaxID=255433 RepID=UPI00259A4C62|nr:M43 family zinc metalloprotease [uncultured Zobellia sp.]